MQISDNRAVAVEYKLTLDNGIVVDASDPGDPLWYLHGHAQLLPRFEKELTGLNAGDAKEFSLTPKEGYGEFDEAKVVEVDKRSLNGNDFTPGAEVSLRSRNGQQAHGRILSVDKSTVKVNLNHELAGKNLNFSIRVVEVRAATKQELAHGHIHDGGHDHGHDAGHEEEHVHGPGCRH